MRPTAVAAYEDFTRNCPSVSPDISRSLARVRLNPPPQPLLKVNFDGAVFNEDRKAGVMIVICRGGATARLAPPPTQILKNYFILCISIKKFKYLAKK